MSAAAAGAYRPPSALPAPVNAPAAPSGFHAVASVDAIPTGLSSAMAFPSGPLCIARTSSGAFFALSLYCAHKNAELHLGDLEDLPASSACGAASPGVSVRCPRHRKKFPGGLLFDASTGAAWCAAEPSASDWNSSWGCSGDVPAFSTVVADGWLFVSSSPVTGTLSAGAGAISAGAGGAEARLDA